MTQEERYRCQWQIEIAQREKNRAGMKPISGLFSAGTASNNSNIASSNHSDESSEEEDESSDDEIQIMELDPILASLEETDDTDEGDGVMQRYLKAVYERLRFELTKRSNINEQQWLYDMLKAYDWWIPGYPHI